MAHILNDHLKEVIGLNIRRIREKKGLTQDDVANEAGFNPDYYPRIERGEANITLGTLYKVLKALKIKSSDILPF